MKRGRQCSSANVISITYYSSALAMVDFRGRSYIWLCSLGFVWYSSSRKATRCLTNLAHSIVPPPTTVSHRVLSITSRREGRCWYLYLLSISPADLDIPESGCSLLGYFSYLAQRRHDMVGLWSLPAASILLLQVALSLEAPAGGKRCIYSVFCPSDEVKPTP